MPNNLIPSNPLKTTWSEDDQSRIICGVYSVEEEKPHRFLQLVLHPNYVNLINPGSYRGKATDRNPMCFSLTNSEAYALYTILHQRYQERKPE